MSRKLDVLVAERVMAVKPNPQIKYAIESADGSYFTVEPYKPYSSFIAAAWEVVEKFEVVKITKGVEMAACAIGIDSRHPAWKDAKDYVLDELGGSSVPLAICVAALRACAVPESEIEEAMKDG